MEVIRRYNSVQELVKQARRRSPDSDLGRGSRTEETSWAWDFAVGWKGALRLVEAGWVTGAEEIKKVLDRVTDILKPATFEQEVKYDVTGGFIDVGAYLNGEPNCFGSFSPPEQTRKVIRVTVNASASGRIPSSALMNRGAAIGAAIDTLENRGYMVELDLIDTSEKITGDMYVTIVRVKESDQPLDLDRLAFCLGHPAFLRRICFGVAETEPKNIRKRFGFWEGGGYGRPVDYRPKDCELYFARTYSGEERYFVTAESSAEWVKDKLVKANLVDFERRA